jgi:hypothetical protein
VRTAALAGPLLQPPCLRHVQHGNGNIFLHIVAWLFRGCVLVWCSARVLAWCRMRSSGRFWADVGVYVLPSILQGLIPNLIKLAPAAGISWYVFEETKLLLGVDPRT